MRPEADIQSPHSETREPQADEPRYLGVIDLFVRVTFTYFAVVGAALAIDFVRGDGLAFRSWISFVLQSGAAFLLAMIVARRKLPPSLAAIIGLALAAGTLAGGFFPDTEGYQRRAPEPFWRALCALVPLAIAVYLAPRSGEKNQPAAPAVPMQPPLTGEARDAAVSALEMFDRGEQAFAEFQQRVASGMTISAADAETLWARLDGQGYVARLRQMPPEHAITRALREGAVAQTDAVYLVAIAHGAHDAMGHTAESARDFIAEVASRRAQPGADAETLLAVACRAAREHRDTAAGLLQASRFGSAVTSA